MTVGDIVDDAGSRIRNIRFGEIIVFGNSGGCSAPAADVKDGRDLIQTRGSIELPATGRWGIPGGQRLHTIGRWPWSRQRSALTTGGRLDIPIDPLAMQLELTLVLGGDRGLSAVRCESTLVEADRLGRWTFAGTASVGGLTLARITLRAWYQGVFDHGARPVALLRIGARLPPPANRPSKGRPRARVVDLYGDINACRLYSYPARSLRPSSMT